MAWQLEVGEPAPGQVEARAGGGRPGTLSSCPVPAGPGEVGVGHPDGGSAHPEPCCPQVLEGWEWGIQVGDGGLHTLNPAARRSWRSA